MTDKWVNRFLQRAVDIAQWSKDPDRKVGAIVTSSTNRVLSEGYNGFPQGLKLHEAAVEDKSVKLAYTVHAEMNCILGLLASFRVSPERRDRSMFLTTPPCIDCAKFIAATTELTGIKWIHVLHNNLDNSKWNESIKQGAELLNQMGYLITKHYGADHVTHETP